MLVCVHELLQKLVMVAVCSPELLTWVNIQNDHTPKSCEVDFLGEDGPLIAEHAGENSTATKAHVLCFMAKTVHVDPMTVIHAYYFLISCALFPFRVPFHVLINREQPY